MKRVKRYNSEIKRKKERQRKKNSLRAPAMEFLLTWKDRMPPGDLNTKILIYKIH